MASCGSFFPPCMLIASVSTQENWLNLSVALSQMLDYGVVMLRSTRKLPSSYVLFSWWVSLSIKDGKYIWIIEPSSSVLVLNVIKPQNLSFSLYLTHTHTCPATSINMPPVFQKSQTYLNFVLSNDRPPVYSSAID